MKLDEMSLDAFSALLSDTDALPKRYREVVDALETNKTFRYEAVRVLIESAKQIEDLRTALILGKRASEIVAGAIKLINIPLAQRGHGQDWT